MMAHTQLCKQKEIRVFELNVCWDAALTKKVKLTQQAKWGGMRQDYDPEENCKQFAKQTLQRMSMCFEMTNEERTSCEAHK